MINDGMLKPDLGPAFRQIAEKDLPFAMNLIVTRLAQPLKRDLQKEINTSVSSPTPWTQRSVQARKVRGQGNGFAYEVYLPDEAAGGGIPAATYLGPNIYGGSRGLKRSEKALSRTGILGAGMYAYPGLAAKLDAHGNMPKGDVRKLLSYLGAAEMKAGYSANTSAKRKAAMAKGSKKKGVRGSAFFVSVGKGKIGPSGRVSHLAAGIYQRTAFGGTGKDYLGSAIKPVLIFGRKPTYQKRIKFFETADATLAREVGPTTDAVLQDLLTKWSNGQHSAKAFGQYLGAGRYG